VLLAHPFECGVSLTANDNAPGWDNTVLTLEHFTARDYLADHPTIQAGLDLNQFDLRRRLETLAKLVDFEGHNAFVAVRLENPDAVQSSLGAGCRPAALATDTTDRDFDIDAATRPSPVPL
jgi:hypothetical protein